MHILSKTICTTSTATAASFVTKIDRVSYDMIQTPQLSFQNSATMSSSNFNVLRQLAVAADVPTFVRLASSKAFGALIGKHPEMNSDGCSGRGTARLCSQP
jgi:hypothetical protein